VEGSGNAPPLKSCRYRFTYDDARVTACTTSEPIAVLAPSQGPASPVIGQQSGSWVELRSPDGEVLFHRRVHEAFGPYHEVTRGRIEDGEFDVIVPELSDVAGAEIVVASSEIGPGAGLRAATEVFRARVSDVPVEPPADGVGPVAETIVSPARPDGNQWELVVIGDGYTSTDADAAKFDQDVSAFVAELQGTAPFGDLWDRIRIHRIRTVSDKRGASLASDDTDPGRQTPLRASYFGDWNGEELPRLLKVDAKEASRIAREAVPEMMQTLVLVNSADYGAGSRGRVAVCSTGDGGFRAGIHELGHAAFGLEDEYDYGLGWPPFHEPAAVNVTLDPRVPKWIDAFPDPWPFVRNPKRFAAPADGLPDGVGAFEGAMYHAFDVYRPAAKCRMRRVQDPFCPVCEAAIRTKLHARSPSPSSLLRPEDRERTLVADFEPDAVSEAVVDKAFVIIEGYLADVPDNDSVCALFVDLWMTDQLIIPKEDVLYRIPGSERRARGQSLLWVDRDATITRRVQLDAEQFAYRAVTAEAAGDLPRAGTSTEWRPGPKYPK